MSIIEKHYADVKAPTEGYPKQFGCVTMQTANVMYTSEYVTRDELRESLIMATLEDDQNAKRLIKLALYAKQ